MQVKNWMLTLLLIGGSIWATAQNADTPAYKKTPIVPEFSLLQADSSVLTKNNLKQQATLIMYFSPTCDHCLHQWDDMIKHKDKLKDIQIIMATYQPFEEMQDFYKKQHISTYPNIKMGRDTEFRLVPFYRMRNLPYQALYDKSGKLITTYEGNVKVETMLEAFNGK